MEPAASPYGFNLPGEAGFSVALALALDIYVHMTYNICMKKRINMYLEAEDRQMIAFLRKRYGLDSEASTVRFLIRKAAKEEGYVPGEKSEHRENRSTG